MHPTIFALDQLITSLTDDLSIEYRPHLLSRSLDDLAGRPIMKIEPQLMKLLSECLEKASKMMAISAQSHRYLSSESYISSNSLLSDAGLTSMEDSIIRQTKRVQDATRSEDCDEVISTQQITNGSQQHEEIQEIGIKAKGDDNTSTIFQEVPTLVLENISTVPKLPQEILNNTNPTKSADVVDVDQGVVSATLDNTDCKKEVERLLHVICEHTAGITAHLENMGVAPIAESGDSNTNINYKNFQATLDKDISYIFTEKLQHSNNSIKNKFILNNPTKSLNKIKSSADIENKVTTVSPSTRMYTSYLSMARRCNDCGKLCRKTQNLKQIIKNAEKSRKKTRKRIAELEDRVVALKSSLSSTECNVASIPLTESSMCETSTKDPSVLNFNQPCNDISFDSNNTSSGENSIESSKCVAQSSVKSSIVSSFSPQNTENNSDLMALVSSVSEDSDPKEFHLCSINQLEMPSHCFQDDQVQFSNPLSSNVNNTFELTGKEGFRGDSKMENTELESAAATLANTRQINSSGFQNTRSQAVLDKLIHSVNHKIDTTNGTNVKMMVSNQDSLPIVLSKSQVTENDNRLANQGFGNSNTIQISQNDTPNNSPIHDHDFILESLSKENQLELRNLASNATTLSSLATTLHQLFKSSIPKENPIKRTFNKFLLRDCTLDKATAAYSGTSGISESLIKPKYIEILQAWKSRAIQKLNPNLKKASIFDCNQQIQKCNALEQKFKYLQTKSVVASMEQDKWIKACFELIADTRSILQNGLVNSKDKDPASQEMFSIQSNNRYFGLTAQKLAHKHTMIPNRHKNCNRTIEYLNNTIQSLEQHIGTLMDKIHKENQDKSLIMTSLDKMIGAAAEISTILETPTTANVNDTEYQVSSTHPKTIFYKSTPTLLDGMTRFNDAADLTGSQQSMPDAACKIESILEGFKILKLQIIDLVLGVQERDSFVEKQAQVLAVLKENGIEMHNDFIAAITNCNNENNALRQNVDRLAENLHNQTSTSRQIRFDQTNGFKKFESAIEKITALKAINGSVLHRRLSLPVNTSIISRPEIK
ncbi:hypothetical protein QVD99_001522 [Batrachochytrium dendrobatidis]|nr:hypothetical protein QVD99_001522 [Batrachochytrium dendrobatidis]